MTTLLLDQSAWDLVLDSSSNIALASDPYSLAQDVASAQRLFINELYYDQSQGIPYFQEILGYLPPASLIIQLLEAQALTVPELVSATSSILSFNNRSLTGQTAFVDSSGVTTVINFSGGIE